MKSLLYAIVLLGICHSLGADERFTFSNKDFAYDKKPLGGGGFGASYKITRDLSIRTGPTWLPDHNFDNHYDWALKLEWKIKL